MDNYTYEDAAILETRLPATFVKEVLLALIRELGCREEECGRIYGEISVEGWFFQIEQTNRGLLASIRLDLNEEGIAALAGEALCFGVLRFPFGGEPDITERMLLKRRSSTYTG